MVETPVITAPVVAATEGASPTTLNSSPVVIPVVGAPGAQGGVNTVVTGETATAIPTVIKNEENIIAKENEIKAEVLDATKQVVAGDQAIIQGEKQILASENQIKAQVADATNQVVAGDQAILNGEQKIFAKLEEMNAKIGQLMSQQSTNTPVAASEAAPVTVTPVEQAQTNTFVCMPGIPMTQNPPVPSTVLNTVVAAQPSNAALIANDGVTNMMAG